MRSPTAGRSGGSVPTRRCWWRARHAGRRRGGEPSTQGVGGVGLDADREGDGGVEVERCPEPGQGVDLPEAGHLADAHPPGPHRGGGEGQEQQWPGAAPYGLGGGQRGSGCGARPAARAIDPVTACNAARQRIRPAAPADKQAGLLERRRGYLHLEDLGHRRAAGRRMGCLRRGGGSWWQPTVAVFLAVMFTQAGFLGHDAGRRQIFGSRRANYILGILFR